MASETLTDLAIRKLQPGPKPVRVFDGRGLYLEVTPNGGKVVAPEVPLWGQGKVALHGHLSRHQPEEGTGEA
jgi:hypothetical protein